MACECGDNCTCNTKDLIPDKEAYQVNKRRMAWVLILLMAITTIATLILPERLEGAESILMTQYISMCGLVGAYFGFSAISGRK
tara:strand:- start:913 stop:1164 length:252 start_codon:yes stop_codon:yes gene_type:complete